MYVELESELEPHPVNKNEHENKISKLNNTFLFIKTILPPFYIIIPY